jgi:hypothetical protein
MFARKQTMFHKRFTFVVAAAAAAIAIGGAAHGIASATASAGVCPIASQARPLTG